MWPVPIVDAITTAFTTPGAPVLLVAADTTPAAVTTPGTTDASTTNEESVRTASEAVRALDRTVDTIALDAQSGASMVPPQPFWADLVTDSVVPSANAPMAPSNPAPHGAANGPDATGSNAAERADLALVSLPAHAATAVSLDQLALLAANRLRCGGVFAVYTHSDWHAGKLVDPTGPIVAAAQHADLLYLQHIVTLHTPIRDGHLHAAPTSAVAAEYDRTRHRASVRGLPAPHLRAHSDVLVFAQPASPAGSG